MATPVEEVEDLFCDVLAHRDDAPIIDDPETSPEDTFEESVESVPGLGRGNMSSEALHTRTVYANATMNGTNAESEREVRFASSWLSEKERDLSLVNELECCKLFDERTVDIRIELPIKGFECRNLRELGAPDTGLDRRSSPGIDLSREKR
jgi:hypothetical protein